MILFIDINRQVLKFYSEAGLEEFEFDEVDDLVAKIGKKKVIYVTEFLDASGPQIAQTVNALISRGASSGNASFDDLDNKTFYLQSCKQGVLHIQDIGVTFNGAGDCKQIDEEMAALIQESVVFRNLLKKGVVKIVDYTTMTKASRKQRRQQEKFQKVRQGAKDRDLDSIIVQTDRPGSAEAMASSLFSKKDVEETDITDSIIHDPTANMSEAEIAEAMRTGKIET